MAQRTARDRIDQLLQLVARLGPIEPEAQAGDESGKLSELGRAGRRMHSTQKHQAAAGELLGHSHVGRQHELLDHLVTLVVNRLADPLDSTLPIQLDPNLRQVQLQGTRLEATPAEHSA